MRAKPLTFIFASALTATVCALEPGASSPTSQLKGSVREWIETMREVQKTEDDWDRDREVLNAYRDGLKVEISDLQSQIDSLSKGDDEEDQKAADVLAKFEGLKASEELLKKRLGPIEKEMLEKVAILPPMLMKDGKVAQMVTDLKLAVAAPEDEKPATNSRLNVVLNLLGAAESFQSTVRLDTENRTAADGRELKFSMVYFGLSSAFGVDDAGEIAFVGKPGSAGWEFTENNELAPKIRQLVDVLNGDEDAKFVSLPIALP